MFGSLGETSNAIAAGASLPTLAFASAVAQAEGNSGTTVFTFTLNLTRNGSTAVIPYTWTVTGNGSNPANATDFVGGVLPSGSGSFAAGETSKSIVVNVAGDSTVEPDEGFNVLATATLPAITASVLGTILNDDVTATPTVTISAAQSINEGNSGATLFTYTVTRSTAIGAVLVPWSFTAGTTDATDYTGGVLPAGGNVSMADGVANGTIVISVNGDTTVEPNETFTVLISTPAGYVAGAATSATGTILNDDVTASPRSLTNNAVRLLGPGHGTGTTQGGTSTGVAVTPRTAYTNESKAPITTASLVFIGWFLSTTGTTSVGNDVPVTAQIEYPSGTVVGTFTSGGSATTVIPNGGLIETDRIALSTAIPAGASFVIQISTTLTSGLKYNGPMLGLGAVNSTTADSSSIAKVNAFFVGDSISTNNGAVWYTSATGKCPCIQMSISGTTAQAYAATGAFTKQIALAKAAGCTLLASNWGTNDYGGSRTNAQLEADITTIAGVAAAQGLAVHWATMTPRTQQIKITASAAALDGNNYLVLTVPDASKFVVNHFYTLAGATSTGVNGGKVLLAADTTANTLTFLTIATAGTTPAGTITIADYVGCSEANLMVPISAVYGPGAGSVRGQHNAWIRSGGGGALSGCIEWADNCEPSRDAGRWAVAGESPYITAVRQLKVTSVINSSRFNFAAPSIPNNVFSGGVIIWTAGGNIGTGAGGNGSGTSDATLNAAPTVALAVNDAGQAIFNTSYACSLEANGYEALHPRVALSGQGGQLMIQTPTTAWLAALTA